MYLYRYVKGTVVIDIEFSDFSTLGDIYHLTAFRIYAGKNKIKFEIKSR